MDTVPLATHTRASAAGNASGGAGPKAWSSGSTSLARIAGSATTVKTTPSEPETRNVESWPSLAPASRGSQVPQPRAPGAQRSEDLMRVQQPSAEVQPAVPLQPGTAAAVPQLPLEKRKPAWSPNNSNESSPTSSPPLSPTASPQRGCRKVDGVMVSPEPVESPRSVLQRWLNAGRPAVALYALSVHDAEFRAFRRAVSVVADGEATLDNNTVRSSSTPQRKRFRGEDSPIDHATAVSLMAELSRVDIGAAKRFTQHLPAAAPRPNNAVRCFEFGIVCAPLPMLMQHAC